MYKTYFENKCLNVISISNIYVMLDEILSQLINSVRDAVDDNSELPLDKKEFAVEVSVKTIADNFKKYLVWNNLPILEKMFSKQFDLEAQKISQSIENALTINLISKTGLAFNTSMLTSKCIVDKVLLEFSDKRDTPFDPKFNIYDLIYVFSGEVSVSTRQRHDYSVL